MWVVSASGQFAKPQTSPTKICKHDLRYHHFGKLQSHHFKLLESGLLMEVQHFMSAKDLQGTPILVLAWKNEETKAQRGWLAREDSASWQSSFRSQVTCIMGHIVNVSLYLRVVILKTEHASEPPEGILKTAPWARTPEFGSLGISRAGVRLQEFHTSDQFPGDTMATCLGALLWDTLTLEWGARSFGTQHSWLPARLLPLAWLLERLQPNSEGLSFWHLHLGARNKKQNVHKALAPPRAWIFQSTCSASILQQSFLNYLFSFSAYTTMVTIQTTDKIKDWQKCAAIGIFFASIFIIAKNSK